jgi:hypothetical protein
MLYLPEFSLISEFEGFLYSLKNLCKFYRFLSQFLNTLLLHKI